MKLRKLNDKKNRKSSQKYIYTHTRVSMSVRVHLFVERRRQSFKGMRILVDFLLTTTEVRRQRTDVFNEWGRNNLYPLDMSSKNEG